MIPVVALKVSPLNRMAEANGIFLCFFVVAIFYANP